MKHIYDLTQFKDKIKNKRLAVVNAQDETVLEAVYQAHQIGGIYPILLGDKPKIEQIIKKDNLNFKSFEIIDVKDDTLCAEEAIRMIRENKADLLMKGLIDTKVILRAVVNKEKGIRDKHLLSHVTLFSYPTYDKIIFATDCAMNIYPDVSQKKEIIENVLWLVNRLKIDKPKVALISAVEKENPNIISSVEAAQIRDHYHRLGRTDFVIDGPFAVDNVVSKEAAKIKGIKSPVAGDADILIFPNLDSGNTFYKTSVYLANALAVGLIIGAKAPIILTSRADSLESKLYSILLAGAVSDEA